MLPWEIVLRVNCALKIETTACVTWGKNLCGSFILMETDWAKSETQCACEPAKRLAKQKTTQIYGTHRIFGPNGKESCEERRWEIVMRSLHNELVRDTVPPT